MAEQHCHGDSWSCCHDICENVTRPSLCTLRCQGSKTFPGAFQCPEALKTKSKQPQAFTVAVRPRLSINKPIIKSFCTVWGQAQSLKASAVITPRNPHGKAPPQQSFAGMEESQHSWWQLLSIKSLGQAWEGLCRHLSLHVCCPSLWFMISNTSLVGKHCSDVLLINH